MSSEAGFSVPCQPGWWPPSPTPALLCLELAWSCHNSPRASLRPFPKSPGSAFSTPVIAKFPWSHRDGHPLWGCCRGARATLQAVLVFSERHEPTQLPLPSLSTPVIPSSAPTPPPAQPQGSWVVGSEEQEEAARVAAQGEGRGEEGQRQVGPHVKGAGAGSYYLLGSRCPPASPGSAGSSATENRGQHFSNQQPAATLTGA